jgi:hypothetical protein
MVIGSPIPNTRWLSDQSLDRRRCIEEEIRPQSIGSEHEGLATVGSSITVKRIMAKTHPPTLRNMKS